MFVWTSIRGKQTYNLVQCNVVSKLWIVVISSDFGVEAGSLDRFFTG